VSAPVITEGVYDMPDAEYHAIKYALSCSGAKRLLPPSCPRIFKYELDNGRPAKPAFDLGHAAHKMVLGAGPEIEVIHHDSWRSKDAQARQAAAYAEGKVPLLAIDYERVVGMAEALHRHPLAAALLNPEHGKPEQSLFRVDPETGVSLRSRLDWLPDPGPGRMIIADYKSAISAEPGAIAKAVANFGYAMQDSFYTDMVVALGLAEDPAFVFIFQSKEPPYIVTVAEIDDTAKRIGRGMNRRAIDLYAECLTLDDWPSYATDVVQISLPRWATYLYEEYL
jgi:hypothetical protein